MKQLFKAYENVIDENKTHKFKKIIEQNLSFSKIIGTVSIYLCVICFHILCNGQNVRFF